MLIPRYLARPAFLSLALAPKNYLGLYHSSFSGANVKKVCQSCPSIRETIRRGRYHFPNQSQKLADQPKTKFSEFEEKVEKASNWLSNFPKSKYFHLIRLLLKYLAFLFPSFTGLYQLFSHNSVSGYVDKKMKQRKENIQVKKSKKIENIIHQKEENEYSHVQKELSVFQFRHSRYDKLKQLLLIDDSKLLVYIQTFIGSAVGTNLKRLAWDLTERKSLQDYDNDQKLFKKLYYVNLKEPAIYAVSKDEDSDWGIAKDLNYLLTSIIGTTYSKQSDKSFFQQVKELLTSQQQLDKKNRPKKSILIIEEAQLLQSFLNDKDRKAKLEELYQKIYYVQRKKDVRVFFIGNNNSFFHRFNRQLQTPNLEDCKYQLIERMTEQDIRDIIKCRSKIDQFYKLEGNLKNKFEPYFNKMLDYIVDTNDNIREIMRIMKQGKIDVKEIIHQHNLQKKFDSQLPSFFKLSEQQALQKWKIQCQNLIKKQFRKLYFKSKDNKQKGHYQAMKDIKHKIITVSEEFVDQKKRSIINQIDRASQSSYNGPEKISKEDIIKSKMSILLLIFSKKFSSEKGKPLGDEFLYTMTKSQAVAYEQLNKAEIIHGLQFSSKAYERAFYHILEEQKDNLSKLGQVPFKDYRQNFANHKDRIQKYKQEIKGLQENYEKLYFKNT